MQIVDIARVADIIRKTAQEVILPRFCNLDACDIREKKPGDLVTVADTEAEQLLSAHLTALLPGSLVVGEEAVAADDRVLDRLEGTDPVWILDPVDGTANFANGRKTFCVIVALVQGGRTSHGWIYDPVPDQMTMAVQGEGTWRDGRRLTIGGDMPLSSMVGSVGFRKNERLQQVVAKTLRQGSAGHDYLALTDGRLQFAYFRRLRPWDHAAGVLMHKEAGGYSALLDGTPYRPVYSESALLLTPGKESWGRLAAFYQ